MSTAAAPAEPPVAGRRAQAATVAARGDVPYRVVTYELVFAGARTAVVVELLRGQGVVRGFAERSAAGAAPATYVVAGWARQRDVAGEPVTVLDLALTQLDARRRSRAATDEASAPLAARVVVHETSGDATLTWRR